jgi:ABC-2 type transport system ATP-binding protein
MSENAIEVRGLHRRFPGHHAVRGLSFAIPKGQVIGFIGANGAGKTTTMRIIATLDEPSEGRAFVCGFDTQAEPEEVRRRLGWMPDSYGTYDNMTVWEYLDFFARAHGLKGAKRKARVDDVMAFADLGPLAERPMNRLSKGQAQRLCLGRTLLHDPEVLILDEPAAGLDPKARIEFKNAVRLLAAQGKTLFISSHILSELGEMCSHLLFLNNGALIHQGSADTLRYENASGETGQAVELRVLPSCVEKLQQRLSQMPGLRVSENRTDGAVLMIEDASPEALAALNKQLVLDDIGVIDLRRTERRLEDAFVHMLKEQDKK